MKKVLFAFIVALCAEGVFAQKAAPQIFFWKRAKPSDTGLSEGLSARLHSSLDSTETIRAWAMAKDGVIVDEFYRAPYNAASRFTVHSCSKSITGTLVGIAIEQGLLKGLDEPISTYLPEVKENGGALASITIRHLLTNTSGIAASDSDWSEWRGSPNWLEWIFSRKVTSRPGAVFAYATQNTHLLSAILERASGMGLYDYAKKNLLDKVGMKSAVLTTDAQGIGDGGNGYSMTIEDMLRFGQLYLNKGEWAGEQVVPRYWTLEAGKQHIVRNAGTANYGWQFWARTLNNEDVYFAWGWAGQFIFIIPSKNVVLAFTSNHTGSVAVYLNAVRAIISDKV